MIGGLTILIKKTKKQFIIVITIIILIKELHRIYDKNSKKKVELKEVLNLWEIDIKDFWNFYQMKI